MGYLICQDCKGYYELQPGENPEDFDDECECGGKLRYAVSIDVVDGKSQTVSSKQNKESYQKDEINTGHRSKRYNSNKINKNHKIFIYSIVMVIILDLIWALYLISGTIQSILGFLIVIYMGYNLPKEKIIKYSASFGIIFIIITSIFGGGVSPFSLSGIFAILIFLGLYIVFGYVGFYLKRMVKHE